MLKNSVLAAQADVAADHAASAEPAEDALRAGVPDEAPTDVRYGVLGGLCVAATIAYIQRQSIGVAESSIREEFGLSKGQMGAVMTAFFVSYALFQIPSGVMVRAWGVRRALSAFALTFSLISGLIAGCFGWLSLVAVRLMMGITQAGIFPASTTSVAKWFPPTERGMPNGAVTAFMQVGGIVGAMLTGWLIVGIGWRWMYVAYAVPGVLWAGWFYWWYRNSPAEYYSVKGRTPDGDNANGELMRKAAEHNEPTPWGVLLTNRSMLAVCGQQFCRACAATFFGSWFTTYLLETRGVSLPSAGMLTSLPLTGMALGAFSGGVASDFVYRTTGSLNAARRGISFWCMIFCAALAGLAYFVDDPVLATLLISVGSFWAAVAGTCSYTFTIDVGGRHVPAVFSTMNMCGNIGSAIFPMLVPLFLHLTDDNWDLVLFLFVGLYIVAAGFWLMADASKPIFAEAEKNQGDAP